MTSSARSSQPPAATSKRRHPDRADPQRCKTPRRDRREDRATAGVHLGAARCDPFRPYDQVPRTGGLRSEHQFRGGTLPLLFPSAGDICEWHPHDVNRDRSFGDVLCEPPVGLAPNRQRSANDREPEDLTRGGPITVADSSIVGAAEFPIWTWRAPSAATRMAPSAGSPHSGSMITSTPCSPTASRSAANESDWGARSTVASAPRS